MSVSTYYAFLFLATNSTETLGTVQTSYIPSGFLLGNARRLDKLYSIRCFEVEDKHCWSPNSIRPCYIFAAYNQWNSMSNRPPSCNDAKMPLVGTKRLKEDNWLQKEKWGLREGVNQKQKHYFVYLRHETLADNVIPKFSIAWTSLFVEHCNAISKTNDVKLSCIPLSWFQ